MSTTQQSHPTPPPPSGTRSRVAARVVLAAIVGGLVLALVILIVPGLWPRPAEATAGVPQSTAMESTLGVRFSRVAVVGDGGLVTLSYVVLDAEKAAAFQSDVTHPPVLASESRDESTRRVSIMRPGHNMRAGSTYYLVYQNTAGALHPDEFTTIIYGGLSLPHVPVL
ncbi:MAG: hypothetical protein ABIZ07_14025 [Dermatophilaceae bacterium]